MIRFLLVLIVLVFLTRLLVRVLLRTLRKRVAMFESADSAQDSGNGFNRRVEEAEFEVLESHIRDDTPEGR
jgi:hypothetical protein